MHGIWKLTCCAVLPYIVFSLTQCNCGICQRCYCSYGLAQDMKHCCWVVLLFGYYSTAWPLSANYSIRRQCSTTDWTTFHCKYRTNRAKARPQKHAACVISKVYRKQPDSLSLPHCPPQPSLHMEDCYKAYYMTRSSATADRPHDMLHQLKSCQLLHNCRNKLYKKSK